MAAKRRRLSRSAEFERVYRDSRSHGQDENVSVAAFYEGQTFLYRLVKDLGSAQ